MPRQRRKKDFFERIARQRQLRLERQARLAKQATKTVSEPAPIRSSLRYMPSFYNKSTNWGDTQIVFSILSNRRNYAPFFDSANWLDIRFMQVEPIGGHQGHRYINSFDIVAKNPRTGQVKSFVVKAQQELREGEKPEEIEAAIAVRLAGVHSEKPVAYWRDNAGHQYAVFEMLHGRTMLLAETGDFNVFLKACKQFGRLSKAELFHADTGLKHVFVQRGVPHLFDFESLHLEQRKGIRENDFGFFLAESVAHGWVKDWHQFQKAVIAYIDATGVSRGKGYRLHRLHWLNRMQHFLQDQLLIENASFHVSRTRDEKNNVSVRIKRLKQMLNWAEHPKRELSTTIQDLRDRGERQKKRNANH